MCSGVAQSIPFTSGPIPLCDSSTFTANVSGVGWLGSPWTPWSSWLESLTINITSDHPQTLSISLTSPEGTTLVLSAFNGAGGQNYTGTTFIYDGWTPITTGTAPFTGTTWAPQGGSFSIFNNEYADGTWTISVVDTACANGGIGPGGNWTPGWFDGSGGNGGFAFGFSSGPPPCMGGIPWGQETICPGQTVDILGYYTSQMSWYEYTITPWGNPVPDYTAVSEPGTYSVDAYDPWEGCWYSATFEVIGAPQIDLGPDQTVEQCSGDGPVNLSALFTIPLGTAAWWHDATPISNGASTAVSLPGSYRVVGGYGTGCSDTAYVAVTFPTSPDLGLDQTLSICQGGSADLSTLFNTTGLLSSWSYGGVPFNTPAVASVAGTYTLQASSSEGCTDEASVTLNVSAQPALGPDQSAVVCGGSNVDLTALFDPGGFATTWYFNNAVIPTPTAATTPGTYIVMAGAGNCSDAAQVLLSAATQPNLGADVTASICAGSTVDLTSFYLTGGLSTTWYFGGNVLNTPTSAGSEGQYLLVANTNAGCVDSAVVTVNSDVQPFIGADMTVQFCSNTTFDLSPLYNTTGLDAEWTRLGATVADPTAIMNGGTYRLVVSYGTMCTDTAFVNAELMMSPQLAPDMYASVCQGEGEDLVSYFNFVNVTTAWTLAGVTVPDAGAATEDGLYRVIATNGDGCSDTAFVDLSVDMPPVIGDDQDITACEGTSVDLTALYSTGSNVNAWTFAGAIIDDPYGASEAGAYTLTSTNASGCSASAAVTLTLETAPQLGADQDASVCAGTPFDLTSLYDTAGLSAVWTRSGTIVADPAAVTLTGQYVLEVANAAGCTDEAVVSFTANPLPVPGADATITLCPWQTVDLTTTFNTSGANVSYTFNNDPVSDPTGVSEAGEYVIVLVDENGCTGEATATLSLIDCECVADFAHDAQCVQDPVQFTLLADSTILGVHWDFGGSAVASSAIHPMVEFAAGESVVVTLQATLSCGVVEILRTIELEDCSQRCNVYIPSAFTPNGDDVNEAWTWQGNCDPKNFSMTIFDRFGELIFASTDPDKAWDGTYAGKPTPPGVYAYRVGYTLPYQQHKQVAGSITLLR